MIATFAGRVRYGGRVPLRTCWSWCFAAKASAWLMRSEYPVIVMSRTPGYMRRADESTTTFARKPSHNALEPARVFVIEPATLVRIDVEHGDERALRVQHGNDDLRLCARITSDVTGKLCDIRNDDRASFRSRRSANAATKSDVQAAERALIRSNSKQIGTRHAIESRPQETKRMVDQGSHRRHRGDVIVDAAKNIQQMRMELRIRAILWLM